MSIKIFNEDRKIVYKERTSNETDHWIFDVLRSYMNDDH